MEQSLNPNTARNAWKGSLRAPATGQTALVAAIFFLSCLALPLSDVWLISRLFPVVCIVYCYLLLHRLRSLLYYALPAFAVYLLSAYIPTLQDPMTLVSAFLAILVGGSCGAFLLAHGSTRRLILPLLLPLLAYAPAALLSRDPLQGLLVLLPLTVAVAAAFCLRRLTDRPTSTAVIAATLAISLAVAAVITLAAMHALEGNSLSALAEQMRIGIVNRLVEEQQLQRELMATIKEQSPQLYEAAMELLSISEEEFYNTAVVAVNMAPGIFFAVCAATAFFLWRLLLQQMAVYQTAPHLPLPLVGFSVSRTGAVLFAICGVIALFSGEQTVFNTVCLNLALILAPGLALIGYTSLFTDRRSCLSLLLAIGLVILTFRNLLGGIMVAAFLGSIHVLFARFLPTPGNYDHHDKGEG